jgi:hypothetical protein
MAVQEEEKFSPESLERLKMGDPKFKSPAAWKKFHDEVVVSEFKKFREAARGGRPASPPAAN